MGTSTLPAHDKNMGTQAEIMNQRGYQDGIGKFKAKTMDGKNEAFVFPDLTASEFRSSNQEPGGT